MLTSWETCYEEGSEGLQGCRKQTAVATEWPCLLSPNNAPSSRPQGVLGWAGSLSSSLLVLPLVCRNRCASGQIVSLKCSGESPQGLGRRRWEKEVSLMALGWKSPSGRLACFWGDVLPTHTLGPSCRHSFAETECRPMDASVLSPTSC